MTGNLDDPLLDDLLTVALAESAAAGDIAPSADARERLMVRLQSLPPAGFSLIFRKDDDWVQHAVPGIRMKILSVNAANGYATLLLDVAPGTRFPAHHHSGAEECYVIAGSLHTCGRRLAAGDFVHADAGTDHGELWTDEGCRVLLVAPSDEHLSR
jgi:anti-sigma factor ChrR (cupin superfamily)